MAMFPALMNDTMFSDLFDDPFFEGWRNTDNTMSAVMPANMMTTDVRETDKGYDVDIDMPERYMGSCSRSFYVGEDVKESDIHASYRNGTLCIQVPKMQAQPQVESKHQIAIEG